MKNIFTSLLLLVTIALTAQNREKAFQINEKLGRGINFGNIFEAPSETEWGNPWKPEYAEIISNLGFSHIRMPIRWEPASRSQAVAPYTIYETFFNRIKQAVDSALNNGLYAIINMHHHDVFFGDPEGQKDRLLAQWQQIAETFQDYPDSLLFEILNEPHGDVTPAKWNELVPEVLEIIRETNPERVVLIGTAEYGGLGGLSSLELPEDENIILTVHYYNPFQFTHQGAEWVDNSNGWLGTEWLDTETERDVMRQDFAPLKAYENLHKIPVHIGEFGAYSKADASSRSRWTTFLSRYLEELNWSWAYWEFSAGFGIYNPSTKQLKQDLVDALLHNVMPEPGTYEGTPVYTSNFETGNNGWSLGASQGASAQLSRSENMLNININSGGTAGWHVQLQRGNFSLEAGKKYRYSFKAKADSTRSIVTYLGMSSDPWSPYSGHNGGSVSDTFKVYTYVFDMNATDTKARMVFDLGNSDINFSVTDISVEEIYFQSPTGIFQPKTGKPAFFPNPVKNKLHFLNAEKFDSVSILSLQGKKLMEKTIRETGNQLDVAGLKPGIYIIKFEGKDSFATGKIIKQ